MTKDAPSSADLPGEPLDGIPHAKALGMRLSSDRDGQALVSIPYDPRLIGDPDRGVIHGGVVTTLLDTGCGVASNSGASAGGGMAMVATLDLRIDYMRPAKPGLAIRADCECYHVTRSVAFARGVAYDETPDDPVATANGAFMINRFETDDAGGQGSGGAS